MAAWIILDPGGDGECTEAGNLRRWADICELCHKPPKQSPLASLRRDDWILLSQNYCCLI